MHCQVLWSEWHGQGKTGHTPQTSMPGSAVLRSSNTATREASTIITYPNPASHHSGHLQLAPRKQREEKSLKRSAWLYTKTLDPQRPPRTPFIPFPPRTLHPSRPRLEADGSANEGFGPRRSCTHWPRMIGKLGVICGWELEVDEKSRARGEERENSV
jgi:hypothetical protein